ncbi:unnamed protein product, partial [Amoebophrya sp. A120]
HSETRTNISHFWGRNALSSLWFRPAKTPGRIPSTAPPPPVLLHDGGRDGPIQVSPPITDPVSPLRYAFEDVSAA